MSEVWTDDELMRKNSEGIALQFAKAAAAADGRIIRFTTQFGDCFRVGSYTSSPEQRRLTAKLKSGINILEETDRITPISDQVWELTDKGYEWAENDGGIQIPASSVVILDLLLRAGVAPKNWEQVFAGMELLARDESLDALSQGALPLPQLIFEWAATHGQVDLLAADENEVELTEFYEALIGLREHFDVQMSMPLDPDHHQDLSVMRPFLGQRVKLVNRSEWMPLPGIARDEDFTQEEREELEAFEPPSDLPALTDPGMHLGDQRVGETWVRIAPEHLRDLLQEPVGLLNLLEWLSSTRVAQLRDTLHEQQAKFTSQDIEKITNLLDVVTSWQHVVNNGLDQLKRVPQERQDQAAREILDIIKEPPPMDARVQQLDEFVTELDSIVATKPIDEHGAGKTYRVSNWHDRVIGYLRQHVSDVAANKFVAINAANTSVANLPRWTTEFRTYLLALQRDLADHPEHHKPAPPALQTAQHATKPVGPWGYALLTGIGLIAAIAMLFVLIRYSPSLAADGTLDRIYFLLLVILGLASAAFLFGAIRSYATFTGKVLSGNLELGGPAVIAGLIIIGGFVLAPSTSTFSITARVHDDHGTPISGGNMMLYIGPDTRTAPINANGEADFKEIPSKFRTTTSRLLITGNEYRLADPKTEYPLNEPVFDVIVMKTPDDKAVSPRTFTQRIRIALPDGTPVLARGSITLQLAIPTRAPIESGVVTTLLDITDQGTHPYELNLPGYAPVGRPTILLGETTATVTVHPYPSDAMSRVGSPPREQPTIIKALGDMPSGMRNSDKAVAASPTSVASQPSTSSIPRFVQRGDVILDNDTGLEWTKQDNGKDIDWKSAKEYCADRSGGWRLPTVLELDKIIDKNEGSNRCQEKYGQGPTKCRVSVLFMLTSAGFWTSESANGGEAVLVDFVHGGHHFFKRDDESFKRVLCVRQP